MDPPRAVGGEPVGPRGSNGWEGGGHLAGGRGYPVTPPLVVMGRDVPIGGAPPRVDAGGDGGAPWAHRTPRDAAAVGTPNGDGGGGTTAAGLANGSDDGNGLPAMELWEGRGDIGGGGGSGGLAVLGGGDDGRAARPRDDGAILPPPPSPSRVPPASRRAASVLLAALQTAAGTSAGAARLGPDGVERVLPDLSGLAALGRYALDAWVSGGGA